MKGVGEGAWIRTRVEELRKIRTTDTYINSPAELPDLLEEIFLYLSNLDKTQRDVALANDAHKKCIKVQYDKFVFNEGDLVLTYDQRYDKLGKGNFESM